MKPTLSVILPAYNEAENLPILVGEVHNVLATIEGYAFECIVVNDASTDETDRVLRDLADEYQELRHVRMVRNSGQSAALLAGMRMAEGDYLFTLDADLQNDPRDIPRLLDKLAAYDCVCGYREGRNDSPGRRLTSYLGNLARRIVVDDGVRDAGCGIKGFRRNCVEHIVPFHGVHRFFASMVRNAGLTVTEVPVAHRPRIHGKSKYGFINRIFWVLFDFVGVAWLRRRYLVISCREEVIHVVKAQEVFAAPAAEEALSNQKTVVARSRVGNVGV